MENAHTHVVPFRISDDVTATCGISAADGARVRCALTEPPLPRVIPIARTCVCCTVREIADTDNIRRLLHAIAAHDKGTYRHSVLVANVAVSFAEYLGLGNEYIRRIAEGALLHDVGKLEVPSKLLNKQETLNAEELAKVHSHALAGYKLLVAIGGYFENVLQSVLYHHEKMDGSGYPDGLFGQDIPFVARLIAICDIYAALREPRVYKAAFTISEALRAMRQMRNKLDPEFFRRFRRFVEVKCSRHLADVNIGWCGELAYAETETRQLLADR